ncbi:hypothetical protein TNCV_1258271 [Trichonephila clavipes]|nr:hypothetical protein TNCV_1258271 [Trichonephila clavipes]
MNFFQTDKLTGYVRGRETTRKPIGMLVFKYTTRSLLGGLTAAPHAIPYVLDCDGAISDFHTNPLGESLGPEWRYFTSNPLKKKP